ncbi:MAG: UDP-N-acetylmuramoyl-L-alanine--D-glutamate ligase [bacterium]
MFVFEQIQNLRGKHVVVMGLGLHGGGTATTAWLLRHGARVTVTDLQQRAALRESIAKLPTSRRLSFILGRHRHEDFRSADVIVANPGVPSTSPYLATAQRAGVAVINEATLFFSRCPCRIIGVTGTKGKSTVSSLIAHLLKKSTPTSLAGNIRTTAMLGILDRLTPKMTVVLELSSWQLEGLSSIRRSPEIAVVTNLLDDHLNQYISRRAYFTSKEEIWKYQDPTMSVILNRDNPPLRTRGKGVHGRRYWFSRRYFPEENGAFVRGGKYYFRENGKVSFVASFSDSRLLGEHNVMNTLAAITAAKVCGMKARQIRESLRTFAGVPGRLEIIRSLRGVRYMNDTTATAPAASIAALATVSKPVILIAGGTDKNLPYREMAQAIRSSVQSLILLPGTATVKLQTLLRSFHRPLHLAASMREAVRIAARNARPGTTVLLSPGAASFGLFLHEFDRGEQFEKEVRRLR